jgi:hypothetical protein
LCKAIALLTPVIVTDFNTTPFSKRQLFVTNVNKFVPEDINRGKNHLPFFLKTGKTKTPSEGRGCV